MESPTSTSTSLLASLPVRLLPLQLTPSGRPVLLPGEAERLIQDKADLVFVPTPDEEKKEQADRERGGGGAAGERYERGPLRFPRSLEDGVLRVTTHRLLWVDARAAPSSGSSCSLPLGCVSRAELRATRLWSSAKARVLVSVDGASGRPLPCSSSSASPSLNSSSSSSSLLREIKVVAPGQAAIDAALQASLSAREWERSGGEGGAKEETREGGAAGGSRAAVVAVGATRAALPVSAAEALAHCASRGRGIGPGAASEAEEASRELLERFARLWPPAGGGAGEERRWGVVAAASGVRARPRRSGAGRPPLAGKIEIESDSESESESDGSNWWVIGGLGSRGLLYAAWLGREVARAALAGGGDASLDPELTRWKRWKKP